MKIPYILGKFVNINFVMFPKIVFTICSINYLAQAKILGDSLKKHNPDVDFFIGLVDDIEASGINSKDLPNFNYLELSKIGINGLSEMCDRYEITELNTAVKPFFMQYLYQQYPNAQYVIYFDPDIEIFDSIAPIEEQLQQYNVVLTPHITQPYGDTMWPNEKDLLAVGIYNLGFIATAKSTETDSFLNWWAAKLFDQCYNDVKNGLFVDQLWAMYAPFLWDKVLNYKHLGCNMAYWNLHERVLNVVEGKYLVNNEIPLIFFHYSGYSPRAKDKISKYQERFNFENAPNLKPIFDNYAHQLEANDYHFFQKYPCFYVKPAPANKIPKRGRRPRNWAIDKLNKIIDLLRD